MPAPSLSQRLTNKPSRSYLSSAAGSEDGSAIMDDRRSNASYASRGRESTASFSARLRGITSSSSNAGGYHPSSPGREGGGNVPTGILRGGGGGTRTAASDFGGTRRRYDSAAAAAAPGLPLPRAPALQRNNSIDSNSRRSVTFSDINQSFLHDDDDDDDAELRKYASSKSKRSSRISPASGASHLAASAGPSAALGRPGAHMSRGEIMSEMGGYRRPGGVRRTPSIASSMLDDNASDAGSVTSTTRRRVQRGSKTDRITGAFSSNSISSYASGTSSQQQGAWHRDLGGGGLALGSSSLSKANPLASIVKRKSSGKYLDLANAEPSRRYSLQPTVTPPSPTKKVSATPPLANSVEVDEPAPEPPVIEHLSVPMEPARSTGSQDSSPAGSEVSFNTRTVHHSRHSAKQRQKSGLGPLSASAGAAATTQSTKLNGNVEVVQSKPLRRSSSTGSSASRKSSAASKSSKTASPAVAAAPPTTSNPVAESSNATSSPPPAQPTKTKSSAGDAPPALLHSSMLRNTLLTAPPSATNTRKVKPRSAEKIVEALSKAGLLDRVMEVVNEVDEDETSSTAGQSRRSSLAPSLKEERTESAEDRQTTPSVAAVPMVQGDHEETRSSGPVSEPNAAHEPGAVKPIAVPAGPAGRTTEEATMATMQPDSVALRASSVTANGHNLPQEPVVSNMQSSVAPSAMQEEPLAVGARPKENHSDTARVENDRGRTGTVPMAIDTVLAARAPNGRTSSNSSEEARRTESSEFTKVNTRMATDSMPTPPETPTRPKKIWEELQTSPPRIPASPTRRPSGGYDVSTIMAMNADTSARNKGVPPSPTTTDRTQSTRTVSPRQSTEQERTPTQSYTISEPSSASTYRSASSTSHARDSIALAPAPLSTAFTERESFYTPATELPDTFPDRDAHTEEDEEGDGDATVLMEPAEILETPRADKTAQPFASAPDIATPIAASTIEAWPTSASTAHIDGNLSANNDAKSVPKLDTTVLIPAGTNPMPDQSVPLRLESLTLQTSTTSSSFGRSLEGTILVSWSHTVTALFVRLTYNRWQTFEEVQATATSEKAVEYSRYSFTWQVPPGSQQADVQLALRLEDQNGQAHWDNNGGQNYIAKLPSSRPATPAATPAIPAAPLPSSTAMALPPVPPRSPARASPSGTPSEAPAASKSLDSAATSESGNVAPRVFVTRTQSDERRRESVLFDPNAALGQATRSQDAAIPMAPQASSTGQTSGASPGPPVSEIPFPDLRHRTSASSVSSSTRRGGASAAASTDGFSGRQYATGAPPTQSSTSRGSNDSSNQPFTYPARGQTAASAAAARHRSATEMGAVEMPSIMTALDAHPGMADDLSGIYTQHTRENGSAAPSENGTETADLGGRARGAAASGHGLSAYSENGTVSGRSLSGLSVPNGGYRSGLQERPPSNVERALTSGFVDLPKSNSTMRSLMVTSNAAQTLNRSFFRNNANTKLRQTPGSSSRHGSKAIITFSNLAPVPQKIRPDECLVHVFTCAVDFWDRAKVEILNSKGQGYGFIPGRAFVGRVLDTGSEVDPSKVKRGDFVYGLNDLKKSGALGEFLAVQRGLLTQAPNGALSLEQIAAVALSGVGAYQAMHELCSTLARGSKLVILNAHEGVGAIALQLAAVLRSARDLWIVAHYPPDFADGAAILKALGASECLSGEVLSAIGTLRESSYDAVLDTIGGRKVYDGMKNILHDDGYFVTTVGDALSVPTQKPQWRKSLRALFGRKDKMEKHIRYWFPSPENDQRAALERLREIIEGGQLKPAVRRVYRFEEGAEAFKGAKEQAVIMLLDQDRS